MIKKDISLVLIAVIAIGSIVYVQANTTNQTGNQTSNSSSLYANPAQADAHCTTAGGDNNPSDNQRGNVKQCGQLGDNEPKEPIRNCDSNGLKDNNGDGELSCKFRGNN